jgi:hypothetical protein
MAFLKRGAQKAIRRFFPEQVAEDAGVQFLSRGGFLRERLDSIVLANDDVDSLKRRHIKNVLPWLNTGGNTDHFDRNDAMNDLLEYHKELCEHILFLRLREFNKIQDGIRAKRLALKIEGKKEVDLPKLLVDKDIEEIPIDHELERHRHRIERYLGWGGDTLLGISLEDPGDNKNLIMRTPVILDQTKTRKVLVGGGPDGDVKTIPG